MSQHQKQQTALKDEDGPRSFSQFIAGLAEGDAHAQLSEELQDLGRQLLVQSRKQNKTVKGRLRLTLDFAAEPEGLVAVLYDVESKPPKPRRPGAVRWITKTGNLSEKNPRQQDLPLREVASDDGPARDVEDDGPAIEVNS